MKRWLPLLLALALALGCAGCAKRQTVTVYRIAKEGAALMETEAVTVPDGTDPVQAAIDALGAAPGDSTCFNPVRGWLTLGSYRIDDAGTLWLTVTDSDTVSGIVRTQADGHGTRRRVGRRTRRGGRRRAARADDRR